MQRAFTGFASGVMVAASFFSLLLPALDQTENMGRLGFIPASVGFALGMLFLLFLDMVIPHMHLDSSEEGMESGLKRTTKLVLAVTLHNIPEGMAVGIVCAGWMYGNEKVSGLDACPFQSLYRCGIALDGHYVGFFADGGQTA